MLKAVGTIDITELTKDLTSDQVEEMKQLWINDGRQVFVKVDSDIRYDDAFNQFYKEHVEDYISNISSETSV